ncbi:PH domain-containing protein [Streptomyces humi]|uniref:PH domain-containing protein n=1 Tax=Streptomyces humi TaxID=1428620 RepID=UPI00062892BA|nr:PH domain-containing protein [Streptomyces humi]
MSETVFRYTGRQRLVMWGWALLMAAWAGAVTVDAGRDLAEHRIGTAVPVWLVLGLAPTVLFVVLAGMSTGVTRIDAQGLRTRGMTGRRRVAWPDIESVHELPGRGRRGTITQIGVTRTDGTSFLLPIPYTSGVVLEDPDFHDKLELIRREWRRGRST